MLPLIFKTEGVLNPLLSFPPSSEHSCFSLLPNAHKSRPDGNSQRPLQSHRGHLGGGTWPEQSLSVLPGHPRPGPPCSCLAPDTALSAWLCPTHHCPLRTHAAPPPALESLRGHLVIRCPSDVFTFFLTADTSGAHIQVIPVPLDTFHKIISAVVMAIFLPPVIFKLHDRNSWS